MNHKRSVYEQPAAPEHAECTLSEEKLAGYRQWLSELDEEAHEAGGDPSVCDPELWEYFSPASRIGRQVYESFTDEELLDILIRTMNHHGHKPRFEEVYCVYIEYIRKRFGNLATAKEKARTRMKRLAAMAKWPADWPERVSAQPLLEDCARLKRPIREEDQALLRRLCDTALGTGYPPDLTPAEVKTLDCYGGWKRVFEAMGIPALKGAEARYMRKYWAQQRTPATPDAVAAEQEETQ